MIINSNENYIDYDNAFFNPSATSLIDSSIQQIGAYAFRDHPSLTTVSCNNCARIGSYAFRSTPVATISFPNCTYIGNYAFCNCSYLSEASFPNCADIGSSAFLNCTNLTAVNMPNCSEVHISAFAGCYTLSELTLPNCEYFVSQAIYGCSGLCSVTIGKCSSLSYTFFSAASSTLTYVNLGSLESTSAYFSMWWSSTTLMTTESAMFYKFSNLTTAILPNVSNIEYLTFYTCTNLTTVSIPNARVIGGSKKETTGYSGTGTTYYRIGAFQSCRALRTISLPAATHISTFAFSGCYNLSSLYLLGSSVVSLEAISAFNSTPLYNYSTSAGGWGKIYVPASLFNAYVTAANWSTISSRFVSV